MSFERFICPDFFDLKGMSGLCLIQTKSDVLR